MYREIKINKLLLYSTFVSNVLKGVALFNKSGNERSGWNDLIDIELYVKNYNIHAGHYSFTSKRIDNTLEIYIDNELVLSITMCEVHELKPTEVNY